MFGILRIIGSNVVGGAEMKALENLFLNLGIDSEKEISKLFRDEICPEDSNLIDKFQRDVNKRKELIKLLMENDFVQKNISEFNVFEVGGGVCSTGAAFADKCNAVISLELEKVHCLYAKRCKEYFQIDNLGIFHGGLTEVDDNDKYFVEENTIDLVISHMGMFRYTVLDTLEKISSMLRHRGKFICVYPRFWTDSDEINDIDKELLNRAVLKNIDWRRFKEQFEDKLSVLGFQVEYNNILDKYRDIPIGGDVILGSKIVSSREEYIKNPIEGITFGKTLITCNTLICSK
jgi:hypothetical protein